MRPLFLLLALLVILITAACDRKGTELSETSPSVMESRPAPEITLSGLDGSRLRLSDLRGKVVLLNFWTTWCPPCREEIPSMMRLNTIMKGRPFQIVAVSLDEGGKAAVEEFFRTNGYYLPTYTDPDGRAAASYGVSGFPNTFIVDKKGLIVKKIVGPVDWGAAEVIAMINELMG